jgi:hypothetical protein
MSTDRGADIWTSVLGLEPADAFRGAAAFLALGAAVVEGARFLTVLRDACSAAWPAGVSFPGFGPAVFPAVFLDFAPVVFPACFSTGFSNFSDFSSVIQLSVINNEDYTNAQFSTPTRPLARGR